MMERHPGEWVEGVVYPSFHFLTRQAARENLAAKRALTEAARERHLAMAQDFQKRAEAMRASG